MMGTAKFLNSSENIQVVSFMEQEILRMAKEMNFDGIITTNTNQLSRQIDEILGYKVLKNFQVNRYVDKYGNRPFEKADDYQKMVTMWMEIIDE